MALRLENVGAARMRRQHLYTLRQEVSLIRAVMRVLMGSTPPLQADVTDAIRPSCVAMLARVLSLASSSSSSEHLLTCPHGQVHYGDGSACRGGTLPNCALWGNAGLPRCPDGPVQCACQSGFSGSTCEHCDVQGECNGHADWCHANAEGWLQCMTQGAIGCHVGWRGEDCGQCDSDHFCTGHGTCSPVVASATCACHACSSSNGCWAGEACNLCASDYYPAGICNVHCTDAINCNGHGSCDGAGACTCNLGWRGSAVCDRISSEWLSGNDCPRELPREVNRRSGEVQCDCDAGQYLWSSLGCSNCPAGQVSESSGASSCQDCAADTYQGSAGQTSCLNCG
eukprot:SAG22_NODE_5118_length_1082_cov_1.655137_1_plen_340_part_01